MPEEPRETVTALLFRWREGDTAALDQLVPMVYDELRRLARAHLRAQWNPSLQPTALVHELYLRLAESDRMIVRDRTQFFAIAARVMRQVLVDHARRRLADKRGGGVAEAADDAVAVHDHTGDLGSNRIAVTAHGWCEELPPLDGTLLICVPMRPATAVRQPFGLDAL